MRLDTQPASRGGFTIVQNDTRDDAGQALDQAGAEERRVSESAGGVLALPIPARGGSIELLRPY
jgi:hypothetical protein